LSVRVRRGGGFGGVGGGFEWSRCGLTRGVGALHPTVHGLVGKRESVSHATITEVLDHMCKSSMLSRRGQVTFSRIEDYSLSHYVPEEPPGVLVVLQYSR